MGLVMKTMKLPSFKAVIAVAPFTNILFVCWFLWQVIKLGWMKLLDWMGGTASEPTAAHQARVQANQHLFAVGLLSAGLLWFIFGELSPINAVTRVIGQYLFFGARNLWDLTTNFQLH